MPRIEKTVFISYRRTNLPWALFIWQNLTMHGYDVFFDYQSIDSGSFEKVILENIKARAHFIVILTPSALERCKNPGDWLRREIETAIDEDRNIVPLMMEGFDFGSPLVKEALTGKLALLSGINALPVPEAYAVEAMNRLRDRFLNIALSDVHLPVLQAEAEKVTEIQQSAAGEAAPVGEEELSAQTWFERGYVFQKDGNLEEALRCYSEALQLDPDLDAAHNNLGTIFTDLKRYAEAEDAFRKAIAKDPNYAAAYYNLGILLKKLERYTEAEDAYRQAIAKDPNYGAAYYNLGNLLRVMNKERDAITVLEKIMEIDPENFNSYLGISSIKKMLGESIEPSFIEKARQLIPEDDFYNRACLESVCDHFDLAFDYLRKAVQKEKFNPKWAWEDPDLQWIRGDPRFAEIVGPKPENKNSEI
jgi:tetratricopeptide (TPR) repeat protein